RLRPVDDTPERPHPADLGKWPGLMDATGRIPPVGTDGRLRPADSSGRIPPVTNGRMRPVAPAPASALAAPAVSNGRMRPVPPPPPTNGRMVPAQGNGSAESHGRMRPADARPLETYGGRMRPVPPPPPPPPVNGN